MAMKKAEMQAHNADYQARMSAAREAESNGLYRSAIAAAKSAWEHLDGMMQYESRYEHAESTSIAAVEMVLRCAPLLLHFRSWHALETLLKTHKRIARKFSVNSTGRLADAHSLLSYNHQLWTYIDGEREVRQDELSQALGGNQEYWKWVSETWEKMGLIRRTPRGGSFVLSLSTRMAEVVNAKCPACGMSAKAPKAMFFEELACPECRSKVLFVLR